MTNVLTANQANGTETGSATGIVTTGAGSTVTSSTTEKFSGSRSIKCVCAGSAAAEGMKTTGTAVTFTPGPMTFTAKVWSSVQQEITLAVSSSATSVNTGATKVVPATTWTTLVFVLNVTTAATDGVLSIRTGQTQAGTLYVDELGAWSGVGGSWVPGGVEVLNVGGVNSNQVDYYAGLAPISATERNAIANGKNDNEVDWLPLTDQALTLTAEENPDDEYSLTWDFTIAPPVQVMLDFDDGKQELVEGGSVSHTYTHAQDQQELTATATWPGYTTDTVTFTVIETPI